MHHILKIAKCFFEPVQERIKNFEIRRNSDRGFQAGDTVRFMEVNDAGLTTRRSVDATISYVLNYAQKEDYVVFGFKLDEPDKPALDKEALSSLLTRFNCADALLRELVEQGPNPATLFAVREYVNTPKLDE
jgi:hypothetical protein